MKKQDLTNINLSTEDLKKIANKKIFFGHQSVGYNIIEGIKDIMQEMPNIKLNIQETTNPVDFQEPIFAHSRVGYNLDPISKINDFKMIIESGVGDKVGIAFFKFCYVDFNKDTNIDYVFQYYTETMSHLKSKYPEVKFIHVTVPLTQSQSTNGIKGKIKRLIGRSFWGEADNIKRNLFNQMLVKRYGEKDELFDLARYEATYPNGKKNFFDKDGYKYFSLIPQYTDDGGHLNPVGKKIIGLQLLNFLIKHCLK